MHADRRGRPFQPGNTTGRGRPPGSRNSATVAVERLFEQNAEPPANRCIELAIKRGSHGSPPVHGAGIATCKTNLVNFQLPAVRTLADLPLAADAVLQAIAHGEITCADGQQTIGMLDFFRASLATTDFDQRLQALEEKDQAREQTPDAPGVWHGPYPPIRTVANFDQPAPMPALSQAIPVRWYMPMNSGTGHPRISVILLYLSANNLPFRISSQHVIARHSNPTASGEFFRSIRRLYLRTLAATRSAPA